MKKFLILIVGGFWLLISCDGMNDIIQDYLDRGEVNYIGKVDSAFTFSGNERIGFKWQINSDPRIEYCKIIWDGGQDTLVYKINRAEVDENNYVSVIFEGLEEGSYIFYMFHTGDKGYDSIKEEITGRIYGELYQSNLTIRRVRNLKIDNEKAIIDWSVPEDDVISCAIIYENKEGGKSEIVIPASQSLTEIDDYLPGGEFITRTDYLPEENAIDIFSIFSEEMYFPE